MSEQPIPQPANAHRLRIGDFVVTTLQDAYFQAAFELITGIDADETQRLHRASRRPTPPRVTLNAYLLDTGDRKILIDTGFGPLAPGDGGRLLTSLESADVGADDIDSILITHVHPDHIGGLIDADDRPVFPHADVLIPAGELDYWGADAPEGATDTQQQHFAAAHRVLQACGSQIQHLEGVDVMPGVTRVPLPGHTPDHGGYRITSGNDQLLLWADIVHFPHIQFARPEATVAFDTDPAQAAETRRNIFAEVAASGEMVAGHHIDFPGVGTVVEDGEGYRFLPHVWNPGA